MEQLLIEEAIKASIQKNKIVRYMDMFRQVCLDAIEPVVFHKNNQMQEFDKWKEENNWVYMKKENKTPYRKWVKGGFIYASFSELFEIFIKETLNK